MRQFLYVTLCTHLLGVLILTPGCSRVAHHRQNPWGRAVRKGPSGMGNPAWQRAHFPGEDEAEEQTTLPPLKNKLRREELGSPTGVCPHTARGQGILSPPQPIPTMGRSLHVQRCSWSLGMSSSQASHQPHHMYRSRPEGKLGCLM